MIEYYTRILYVCTIHVYILYLYYNKQDVPKRPSVLVFFSAGGPFPPERSYCIGSFE